VRFRPEIPLHRPGVRHYAVSRWDAPLDSGLRDRSLFDVGARLKARVGCGEDIVVLVRPDDHVAAIVPMRPGIVDQLLERILS
jgi:3-(3-hydroxy-phenyl)propionate hydroxylase